MKKNIIQYEDWQKLDIRVGKIVKAEKIEGSEKLLHLHVDFGEDYGTVEIRSGIAQFYQIEELENKKFLFIANLQPRKIFGSFSNGMILAVDFVEKPILLPIDDKVPNGAIVR